MNTFIYVWEIEMKRYLLILLAASLSAATVFAEPALNANGYIDGESIRFDAQSGNYIVTYYGDTGDPAKGDRLITQIYDTPNKIKPGVREQLRSTRGRDIYYRYEFSNDKSAKQDIYALGFTVRTPWWENASLVTNAAAASQASAGNLLGTAAMIESKLTYVDSVLAARMQQTDRWLPEVSFAKTNKAFRLSWQAHPNKPVLDDIKPGQSRKGFGLILPYLPGLVTVNFEGNSEPFKFQGAAGGDSKIWKDIDKLMSGSTAPAPSVQSLGPKVLIPEPFNAKVLADNISNDLASWVEAGQLSEPLAQRLRGSMAALGAAAELNNPVGVASNAERVFYELFTRFKGMRYEDVEEESDSARRRYDHAEISRLAARAIAFNTFEVTRRYFVVLWSKSK
ncbi:MAG: hypothetical protein ACKVOO_02995 [Burkholderiaceae bacterium]